MAYFAIQSILEAIGHTPVIRLKQFESEGGAALYAKYEAGNPSLSIKDRIALAMIQQAKDQGKIKPDTWIVDATAGNTGIALAMVCAVKKLRLILFMPEDASLERRKMFEGFGARLELTPKEEGLKGAVRRADDFMEKHPNSYSPRQFENVENPKAHKKTTAHEILEDFPEGIDALVVGVGTGGTLTGVGEVLKSKFSALKIVAVEPTASAVLSGKKPGSHRIQQLGVGFVPKILNHSLIDQVETVTDDEAFAMTRHLSRKAGILVGISSGANVHASVKVAQKIGPGKKVLTFLCDAGQRYFSLEKFFKGDLITPPSPLLP